MKKILTYKGAVMTWECDSNHHMNVMYYINKFEHAGRNFALHMGLTKEYLTNREMGIVVLEQQIKYLREVFEDDLIYVESSLINVGNKAYTLYHEMFNGQTLECVSTMHITLVLFDKQARRALKFPEELKSRLTGKF